MKRILKYLLRLILAIFTLLILIVFLLYLPPVQNIIRKQAVKYITSHYALDVKIGKLSIGFPLNLRVEDVFAGKSATDTLVAARSIRLDVGFRHILQSELALDKLTLDSVKFVLPGDSSTINLNVDVSLLTLEDGRIYLKKKTIEAGDIALQRGRVSLQLPQTSPTPDTVSTTPADWTFVVGQIGLKQVDFQMKSVSLPYLGAGIGEGQILEGTVSLGRQTVDVRKVFIDKAWCDLQIGEGNDVREADTENLPESVADSMKKLWTVRAGSLFLQNSSFSLTAGQKKQTEFFLSGIGIQLDSVYNRGTVVRGALRDLKVVQRDGVQIQNMVADVDLDTNSVSLGKVYIRTLYSTIDMNVRSNTPIAGILKETPLDVTLDAIVGLEDIQPFYQHIPSRLSKKTVRVKTSLSASSGRIHIDRLQASMRGHFDVKAAGNLSSWQNLKTVSGNFNLQGTFPDITFLNDWLKNSRVKVPRNMTFSGDFKAIRGIMDASVRFCQGKGCVTLEANYNKSGEIYNTLLELNKFSIHNFLPSDSLGTVSAALRMAGRHFSWERAESEIVAEIHELEYKRHLYRDIRLDASLLRTHLKGELKCPAPDSRFGLSFNCDSVGDQYQALVKGKIGNVDLEALHLMSSPLAVELGFDIRAQMGKNELYELGVQFDSIYMTDHIRRNDLGHIKIGMNSNRDKTTVNITSGDFALAFRSDTALMSTVKMFGVAAKEIGRQVAHWDIDLEKIQPDLPVFSLDIESKQNNTVARYLKVRDIGFRSFSVLVSSKSQGGLRFASLVKAPYYKNVRLDSIQASVWQSNKSLAYSLGVDGSADIQKGPFSVNATGNVLDDHLRMELKQKDGKGETGFDLGVDLTMGDSVFSASLFPMTPILGYSRWIINPDNRIEIIKKSKLVKANLRLAYGDKLVSVQSLENEREQKDRLKIEIKGIDLAAFSRLLPFSPDLAGELSTDLLLYNSGNLLGVDGDVRIDDFYYQQQRVGTVDLGMKYSLGQQFSAHAVDFELKLDSLRRAVISGEFSTADTNKNVYIDMHIADFPLRVVNAFMPDNLVKLQGGLDGNIRFRGTLDAPELDGGLAFRQGRAEVLMLGTTFMLDSSRIAITGDKIEFNNYRLIAPNQSELSLNGDIRLLPFDKMGMNLSMKGGNFEVVNVKQNPSSLVFGKAYVDLNARMEGTFSALSLTGNVNLLNNTAITYTLRSSDPQLQDKSIDLVRFISFSDTTLNEKDRLTNRIKVNNFVLKMLLEIGNNVNMNVNLSEDGQDNIQIQGGGNLILAMNPENGLTLAGKYILTSGTVTYNVPVAGKKRFSIQNGSYVEWTGNMINPRLSISAGELVKATVEDGDRNRLVTFESIIRIQNTLSQPEITFDLSAPSDMVIQNQLATFSPEERTKQAMSLLIYGTYTGPGAVSSGGGNVANNALYGFVENELNKYTRKTGLTFGFDSYNTTNENVRTDFTYQFSRQLFNDKINVKIGGRVSSDNNNDGNSGNIQDNLVDDISIEYMFTKKRDLFLKVFRHSNYESVLEGEVTQTGIGIVWRKSYRKLKDLFIRKSKRETVKENQK